MSELERRLASLENYCAKLGQRTASLEETNNRLIKLLEDLSGMIKQMDRDLTPFRTISHKPLTTDHPQNKTLSGLVRQPRGDEWQCQKCGTCNAGKAAKCMGCGE